MTEAERLHDEAMRHAQEAHLARNSDDEEAALACFRRAFEMELQAVRAYFGGTEPTRSILLRSAASLAMECGEWREAERLAAEGLLGDPPVAIAGELRDVMAAACSGLDRSLVGRSAADLAAICLLHDLDNAGVVVVWLGDLLDRGHAASAGPPDLQLTADELNELRLFLDSQFATTWIDCKIPVRGFDDFRQQLRYVQAVLAECLRERELPEQAHQVRLSEQSNDKLTASWDGLSNTLQGFYGQVFPDDRLPDLEPSHLHAVWSISLPEGARLIRLAGVVRRLPGAQRRVVRTALAGAGMVNGDLHEFDTYAEMFLQERSSQMLDPNRGERPDRVADAFLEEQFVEDVVKDEMRQGNIATARAQPGRYAEATAASWLVEAVAFGSRDPCFLAANYAKVLARHLAEDDLSQRIVWRVCVRILAEAGLVMEPVPASIRSLFRIAKDESLSDVAEWLRREQAMADLGQSRDQTQERRRRDVAKARPKT